MLPFCVVVMALHSERSRMKAQWVVLFPDHVYGNGAEFIEGRCLCRSAIWSFVHITQHRKLSMFSSHLSPGMHLWYDFSGRKFIPFKLHGMFSVKVKSYFGMTFILLFFQFCILHIGVIFYVYVLNPIVVLQ